MISGDDFTRIRKELKQYFPEVTSIKTKTEQTDESTYYQSCYLYLNKSRKIILKFSNDYLESYSFEDFSKHLQRNIYYIMKSNINKQIYLLKNFEIEIDETTYANA